MKISYLVIPALAILTAYRATKFARAGLYSWYAGLRKPNWAPTRKLLREIWIFLYLLVSFAIFLYWTVTQLGFWNYLLGVIFLVNAYLNVTWAKAFFVEHSFAKAYKRLTYLNITTALAIIIMWAIYLLPALLLIPYLVLGALTMKFTKELWALNK